MTDFFDDDYKRPRRCKECHSSGEYMKLERGWGLCDPVDCPFCTKEQRAKYQAYSAKEVALEALKRRMARAILVWNDDEEGDHSELVRVALELEKLR